MHWIKPSNFCIVEKDNDEATWDNDRTRTLNIGGQVMMIVATIMVTFKETTMNIHHRVTGSNRDVTIHFTHVARTAPAADHERAFRQSTTYACCSASTC